MSAFKSFSSSALVLLLCLAEVTARSVTVYQQCSYDGHFKRLPIGSYNSVSALGTTKTIASVFVPKGWSVTLYSGSHMTGKHVTVTQSVACLDDFHGLNGRPKSLRVTRENPPDDAVEDESTLAPTKSTFTMQPTTIPRQPASSNGDPTTAPTFAPTKEPETPHPTPLNPTTSPTMSPTSTPTPQPTFHPTSSPTLSPTTHPTLSPTPANTAPPTTAPTIMPTDSPTPSPTPLPTTTPTGAPTLKPTPSPSPAPTTVPTGMPTVAPTTTPTTYPTKAPTYTPTQAPTTAPTLMPTLAPTLMPTLMPTKAPTKTPTMSPTVVTSAPTQRPTTVTKSPTQSPTARTNSPTPRPTPSPTVAPTVASNSIIDGQVYLSAGGDRVALSGASIILESSTSPKTTTTSDSLGHFIFTGLTAGVYAVSAYAGSYIPVSSTQYSVSLDGSLTVTHVDFLFGSSTTSPNTGGGPQKKEQSVIEGDAYIETTDASTGSTRRKALPGAKVTLTPRSSSTSSTTGEDGDGSSSSSATTTVTTVTDHDGHYLFTRLGAGVYTVTYSADDYVPVSSKASITVGITGDKAATRMDLAFHGKGDMRLFRQTFPVKNLFTTTSGGPSFVAAGALALTVIGTAFLVVNLLILYRRRRGYSPLGAGLLHGEGGEDTEPLIASDTVHGAEGELRQVWA